MPKVSVIVPAYNAEKVIERCVRSILDQEFKDLEVIVMNDGSKDSTGEILDTIAAEDDRLQVVHKENSGVSDTRNKALDLAEGDYIQFLDADDWIPANSTKELVRTMEGKNADLVVAEFYRVVGENAARKGSITGDEVLSRQEYAEAMAMSPADYYYGVLWNKLYRRSLIEEFHIRMDPKVSFSEDMIFNLEYILHCERIAPLQVPVYYYVKTEGSLVAKNLSLSKLVEMKTSVFRYYDEFFKNVLDEEEYRQERPLITAFLVSAATDDFAIPLMPGTKKLGEESVPVYFKSAEGSDSLVYYLRKVFDRSMHTAAMKNDLELNDVRIYSALLATKEETTIKELTDYTGIPYASVLISVEALALRQLVKYSLDTKGIHVRIEDRNSQLAQDIHTSISDVMNIALNGFSEEEIQEARTLIVKISDNLTSFLKLDE